MAIKFETTVKDRAELARQIATQAAPGVAVGGLLAPGYKPLTVAAERILHEILLAQYFERVAKQLVTATPEAPRAFRGATADEIKTHLLAMPEDQAKWWSDFFLSVQREGLNEFEFPAAEQPHGTLPLPAEVTASLDRGDINLADLSNPVLALGDLARYDLSKWQGGRKA